MHPDIDSQSALNANSAVVIGASGGIGSAICRLLANDLSITNVIAVSRHDRLAISDAESRGSVIWLTSDHSEGSMQDICQSISALNQPVSRVFIATGILHGEDWGPEKRIESLDPELMHHLFHVNTVIPALWLKALSSLFNSGSRCVITVLSARVGSIQDNRSGGWYSYRASKASLNMVLKTAAVEFARRFPQIRLLAFHPGTTDTDLSKPFLASVPPDKLFTPGFVAQSLFELIEQSPVDNNIQFIDWAGEEVVW